MSTNLWSSNTPERFWLLQTAENGEPAASHEQWQAAIARSVHVLGPPFAVVRTEQGAVDIDAILLQTLGEGQFGPHHWRLSPTRRAYYTLKPFLPRSLTRGLRRLSSRPMQSRSGLGWPIEERYARFQWQVARQLLAVTGRASLSFRFFWPHGRAYALVLTHDVETAQGQSYVRTVADLEERLGFRSSFNFVPERYKLDCSLLSELRERGFEIGVHGLRHDGKLFRSHAEWTRRVARINTALENLDARGFRTPLTHRQPEWMQDLQMEYDLSFFDTDPYEPMPGGTMSLWPFELGHFLELPYTLVQDYTLTSVLGEDSPRLWLEKIDFLREYHGMALLNTHPDYLREDRTGAVYLDFLRAVRDRGGYWHALPGEVARWWRARAASGTGAPGDGGGAQLDSTAVLAGLEPGEIRLETGVLVVGPRARRHVEAEREPAIRAAAAQALFRSMPVKPGVQT